MTIFSKKKETQGELPTAGCGSITAEQFASIYNGEFSEHECETMVEKFFYYGFIAGLAFITCPEGEDMHGKGVREFAENAFVGTYQDEIEKYMNVELADAARSVLERFGISGNIIIAGSFGDDEGDDA